VDGPGPGRDPVGVAIEGRLDPGDVPGLWERVRALPGAGEARLVVCDVSGLSNPDVATVDALARLQLAARRSGCQIRLRRPCARLRGLLVLAGLAEVIPLAAPLLVQPQRQPEEREQPLGVEEEGDPGDLPA
jgi:ABC-type transporter Mla MlaB component